MLYCNGLYEKSVIPYSNRDTSFQTVQNLFKYIN
jgi:hypothetical protein